MPGLLSMEQLEAELDRLGSAIETGSFAEVLRGPARDELLLGVAENFANAAGPQGQAWPARKIPGDGHPLLVQRGDLLNAATGQGAGHTTEVTDRELAVGVTLVHAATHQYGRAGANIPERPYMGASDERLDRIGDLVGQRVEELTGEV